MLRLLAAVKDAHRGDRFLVIHRGRRGDFYDGPAYAKAHREWLATIPYPDHYKPSSNYQSHCVRVDTDRLLEQPSRHSSLRVSYENRREQEHSGQTSIARHVSRFHGRASTILSDVPEQSDRQLERPTPSYTRGPEDESRLSPMFENQAATVPSNANPGPRSYNSGQFSDTIVPEIEGTNLPPRARFRAMEDAQRTTPSSRKYGGGHKVLGPRATAANTTPLGPRVPLKRKASDDDMIMADVGSSTHQVVHDGLIIRGISSGPGRNTLPGRRSSSLLAESVKRLRLTPSSDRLGPYPVSKPIVVVNAHTKKGTSYKHSKALTKFATNTPAEPMDQRKATRIVAQKLLDKLSQSKLLMISSRDALAHRWEADMALREDAATDTMKELSTRMHAVIDALDDARKVANKLL